MRIIFSLLFIILLSFACAGYRENSSKKIHIKGLIDSVEVLRDEWGINHTYVKNQHYLFFARGYCVKGEYTTIYYGATNRNTKGGLTDTYPVSNFILLLSLKYSF